MIETYYINVDVYNDDDLFNKRLSELSMFRRDKTLKYRYRKDQNLSIGVGMLLDYCLRKLGIREKHMNYVLGENGKPSFECDVDSIYMLRNIHFNVSHSGNMAICSWGTVPVGVDIEQIDCKQTSSIPYNMLAAEETKYLLTLPEDERVDAFYRLWTLKESFVKAIGGGLSINFDSFNVLLGSSISVNQSINDDNYYFKEYMLPGYKISICCLEDDFASEPVEIFEKLY